MFNTVLKDSCIRAENDLLTLRRSGFTTWRLRSFLLSCCLTLTLGRSHVVCSHAVSCSAPAQRLRGDVKTVQTPSGAAPVGHTQSVCPISQEALGPSASWLPSQPGYLPTLWMWRDVTEICSYSALLFIVRRLLLLSRAGKLSTWVWFWFFVSSFSKSQFSFIGAGPQVFENLRTCSHTNNHSKQ